MRKVVDTNQLTSDALRTFLAASLRNQVVLSDYVAMEAYQGTTDGVFRSFSVLKDFPKQVVILKNTRNVSRLHGRTKGLQQRLIDERQTKEFVEYIANMQKAQRGDKRYLAAISEHSRIANAHLSSMREDAKTTAAMLRDFYSIYSKEERAAIREGEGYPPGTVQKIIRQVFEIAASCFRQHPMAPRLPSYAELPNTYIFRYSLCNYLLILDWITRGGFENAKPDRLANDSIDMTFVAYATYFDGLLTADQKMARIHQETRIWLSAQFDLQLPGGWLCQGPTTGT